MKKILHVFPLIGGGVIGTDFLKFKGHDVESIATGFSLTGARGNEKPLLDNHGLADIVYWNEAYEDIECDCITCDGDLSFHDDISEEKYAIECKKIEACIEDHRDIINEADAIASIPPCNALAMLNCSTASRSGKGNPASQIIMRCVEFALKSGVKMFVLENAPRLAGPGGLPLLQQIEQRMSNYPEYSMGVVKTNSMWHGMAQRRERTFVFLFKQESCPIMEFDIVINGLEELLGDMDKDIYKYASEPKNDYQLFLKGDSKTLAHNFYAYPEDYYIKWELINKHLFDNDDVTIPVAESVKKIDDIDKWLEEKFDTVDWGELDMTKERRFLHRIHAKLKDGKGYWGWEPLGTWVEKLKKFCTAGVISKNLGHFLHYKFKRCLSFREECRLMGIPDDFKVERSTMHKITQNVPSFTFAAMIEQCLKELAPSGTRFVFQEIKEDGVKTYLGNNIAECLTRKKKPSTINQHEITNL